VSRAASVFSLVGRIPTVLRTLRHVRPAQAFAQMHHMFFGLPAPQPGAGATPTLAITRSQCPFLPPPAHVKGDPAQIELLATPFVLEDRVDWETQEHGPLFAYHLHQQEYLRLSSYDSAARAVRLVDWIEGHPEGVGWDPHPISLRLLCWGRLLLMPGALGPQPELREAMLRSMARQTLMLARGLEVRLQANHLLSNLIAMVWTGLLLETEGASDWRAYSDRLIEELDLQVHPDGGHEERSPMYHSLLLENILDLLNLCLAAADRSPAGLADCLEQTASRMLAALDVLTHPDGRIALFADSGFDLAAEPDALSAYAARLGVRSTEAAARGSALLPQSGYLRLCAGPFVLIASVAGPSPAHQPGHAHCDALSFELSVRGKRLVTDTGSFEYRPGSRRDRARATASHATLEIDGREQAEIWAAHRIGGRPDVEVSAWDGSGCAEITCRGWSRGAPIHRRLFRMEPDQLEMIDCVEGDCRSVVSRLPIDPGWEVEQVDGGARARSVAEDGTECVVRFELPSVFDWTIERAPSFSSFGREVERPVLVGRAARPVTASIRIRIER